MVGKIKQTNHPRTLIEDSGPILSKGPGFIVSVIAIDNRQLQAGQRRELSTGGVYGRGSVPITSDWSACISCEGRRESLAGEPSSNAAVLFSFWP